MARIRTVKPEFWVDEKVVELDPWTRLLFIGMWNFADDQGFLDFAPRRIKMQVFPGDVTDVVPLIDELLKHGLVRAYTSPIGPVLHIVNWTRHQRVDHPAKPRFDAARLAPFDPHDPSGRPREGVRCTCAADNDRTNYPQAVENVYADSREASRELVHEDATQNRRSQIRAVNDEPDDGLFAVDSRETSRTLAPEGKGREGKGSKRTCSTVGRASVHDDPDFERFYATYPRKVGKGRARVAWKAATKRTPAAVIHAGAERYATEQAGADPRFVAHPATWLNGERWLDESTPAKSRHPDRWQPYRNPDNPDTAYNGYKLGQGGDGSAA